MIRADVWDRPLRRTRRAAMLAALAMLGLTAGDVAAYEYEISTQSVGQVYQLPTLRLVGSNLWLARRRYMQSLTLSLWDLGGLRRERLRTRPALAHSGPVVWLTTQLRFDHDFG